MEHVFKLLQHPLSVMCAYSSLTVTLTSIHRSNFRYLRPNVAKKRVHDLVFLGVKLLSEMVRGTADVIREAEREGTSDQ